jgi:ketosteroid isomerase-like protein
LQYKGGAAMRKQALEAWFKTWDGPIVYEIRDLEIETGGDIAFSHSLNRIAGTKTDGEKPDVWVRSTVGYRKVDGTWLVTHEHYSVPFDMKTLEASLDLTP